MDKTHPSLETAVRAIADDSRLALGAHLSLDQLADHRAGRLSAGEDDRVLDHLALCPTCTKLFLDLASFPHLEPPPGAEPASEREIEAEWRAMGPGLLAAAGVEPGRGDATEGGSVLPFGDPRGASRRWQTPALWAAALMLTFGAAWIGTLHQQLAKQGAAQYATVIDIEVARGSRPYPVSPRATQVLLIVHDFDLETYSRGQLQVLRRGTVLHTANLEPSPDDRSLLYLALPRELLPAGSYRIKIFGQISDERGRLDADQQLLKDVGLTLVDQE